MRNMIALNFFFFSPQGAKSWSNVKRSSLRYARDGFVREFELLEI